MGDVVRKNLYRIDDVLLRAGAVTLLLWLGCVAAVIVSGLGEGGPPGRDPGLAALARHATLLTAAALCPAALFAAGLRLRRQEQRILAVWSLLRQSAQISAPGLLANSDFERPDLERAVRVLNNRGLGHYV